MQTVGAAYVVSQCSVYFSSFIEEVFAAGFASVTWLTSDDKRKQGAGWLRRGRGMLAGTCRKKGESWPFHFHGPLELKLTFHL